MRNDLVLIRGGGRTGTAVAHRLRLSGFPVVITEAARPTLIHRLAAFGSAIYESEIEVENVPARRAAGADGLRYILESGAIPVLVDPAALVKETMKPWVVVDAIGLDRNVGTRLTDAPIVIGIGPGFQVGRDVHAIVDSRSGNGLGRTVVEESLDDDVPEGPWTSRLQRIVFSPAAGRFAAQVGFGARVQEGEVLAEVGGVRVLSPCRGLVTGLLLEGLFVGPGVRVAEVDPRNDPRLTSAIDPLARAVAGGVLEAILYTAAVGAAPGQALAAREAEPLPGGGVAPPAPGE
jgi:xanthine dehydrogenase accessory factor